jgi:hypothetical protein
MREPLPCLYDLLAVERELRVPVAVIFAWMRRGDLTPVACDPGGRPLFRAADVLGAGRRLAAQAPVRLFPDRMTERRRQAALVADSDGGNAA